jgi:hypothetical protein
MRLLPTLTIVAMSICAGCVSTPQRPAGNGVSYSNNQVNGLTMCVGLTDTAFSIADRKLRGEAQQTVRESYVSAPNRDLVLPLVEKVYEAQFTHGWDYAVSFYGECALNLAEVPADRTKTPAYCMQNAMIAGIAQTNRNAGTSKEQVIEQFSSFGSDTPRFIINDVYSQSSNRAKTVQDTWNSCMKPFLAI